MSAQAGIWYFDRRPVSESALRVLRSRNASLGADRHGQYVAEGLALLSFGAHFDSLSTGEMQPIVNPDGSVITWDGRLDNRDDFLARLRPATADDISDANLIASSIARWREDALGQAIGDWSLVHWCSRTRTLSLARDFFGNRPLYYRWCPAYIAWSTALESLVPLDKTTEIDDGYVAGWLTTGVPEGRTCYSGISVVPAGHLLCVTEQCSPKVRMVASLTPGRIRYPQQRQYEEHFRALFSEAVRVRLRARGPVWIELSGGYDSSAVTCMAAAHIRNGTVEAARIQPVSVVPKHSPESDESPYIESVEAHCNLSSIRLPAFYEYGLDSSFESGFGVNAPSSPTIRVAEEQGAYVLLGGGFGDVVTTPISGEDALFAHLAGGRLKPLVRDWLTRCRSNREPFIELPGALVSGYRARRRPADRTEAFVAAELVSYAQPHLTELASKYALRRGFLERAANIAPPISGGVRNAPRSFGRLLAGLHVHVSQNLFIAGDDTHMVRRSRPFIHRPLIEYVLSLPPDVVWSAGHPRSFALKALGDILPSAVLRRSSKTYGPAPATREFAGLARRALSTLSDLMLVRLGYAEPTALRSLLTNFIDGKLAESLSVTRLLLGEGLLRRASAILERSLYDTH